MIIYFHLCSVWNVASKPLIRKTIVAVIAPANQFVLNNNKSVAHYYSAVFIETRVQGSHCTMIEKKTTERSILKWSQSRTCQQFKLKRH